MYNLERHEPSGAKYRHVETHCWNLPYPIVKARKNALESIKWPPRTYFKITKN